MYRFFLKYKMLIPNSLKYTAAARSMQMGSGKEERMEIIPTLQECMDKHKKEGKAAIINDGIVAGFKEEGYREYETQNYGRDD